MYSHHVSFEEIVEGVKDDTGKTDLRNKYSQIRRLIYRCEQDIGFSNTMILKKITYSKAKGNIVNKKVRLPDDIVKIESVGMCKEGLCPGHYRIQGNFLFLVHDVSEFSFLYYTLMKDVNGNPLTTQNHKEAVISGVAYYMYKPQRWNNQGSQNVYDTLERYYEDRVGEARGDDFMPTTAEQWSHISNILKMSSAQVLMYDPKKSCYATVEEIVEIPIPPFPDPEPQPEPEPEPDPDPIIINYWQYDNLLDDIDGAEDIDVAFMDSSSAISLSYFRNGNTFNYTLLGRIGFSIRNVNQNAYKIYDTFGIDVTNIMFDTYYNPVLRTQIYISKEYLTPSSLYFRLV